MQRVALKGIGKYEIYLNFSKSVVINKKQFNLYLIELLFSSILF